MVQLQTVAHWLNGLPDFSTTTSLPSPSQTNKRKAGPQAHQLQSMSPPQSEPDMDTTPTRKRPRMTGQDMDPDLTPRPQDGNTQGSAHSQSSRSTSTRSSRSLSPKKQLMSLRLKDRGLEVRQFRAGSVPEQMSELLHKMREVLHGHDILPYDRRNEILNNSYVLDGDVREWRYSFQPEGEQDTLPGRIPTIEEAGLILQLAEECHDLSYDEAGWNVEVHHRILQSVFRGRGSPKGDMFNFLIATTAHPSPTYLPQHIPAKMIDFCIYADLDQDERLREAQRELARHTSTFTINHTDFAPLQLRPIVLSIETKKPSKDLDSANLQIGSWHAAQWSFLASAVRLSLQASQDVGASQSPLEEMELVKRAEAQVNCLPFLPGVVVQGHKWSLVLSTREGQKTILWTEREFGTTQNIQDIFKIVAALRELAAWCKNVYLPWWQDNVLGGFIVGDPSG
ncbi:hypothetical protein EDB81DRAFT_206803 [Dactylonectria macrodidyma]|uniref:PD-(D/E)XK nuclease-like domain-containing protein n=1 Tax=Dactylonectria macrodidyma TaxID=307937 RepID=A0A9P9DT14_9HYPO|nr:hypothetical protein EDB81DRAFT_206803 [Dactylonectria macrodidyma]